MSRQIAEALWIQRSSDNLLNSKCEYLQNCVTGTTVNEETWERKERKKEMIANQGRREKLAG
jgi:hypothetical protein